MDYYRHIKSRSIVLVFLYHTVIIVAYRRKGICLGQYIVQKTTIISRVKWSLWSWNDSDGNMQRTCWVYYFIYDEFYVLLFQMCVLTSWCRLIFWTHRWMWWFQVCVRNSRLHELNHLAQILQTLHNDSLTTANLVHYTDISSDSLTDCVILYFYAGYVCCLQHFDKDNTL